MNAWTIQYAFSLIISQWLCIFCEVCRRPDGGCSGPYVVQLMSSSASVPCTDADLLSRCITACIEDECCLSGGIKNNNYCLLKNELDQATNFIKVLPQEKPQCALGK